MNDAAPSRPPRAPRQTVQPALPEEVDAARAQAAAAAGYLDERTAVLEALTGIRRAGADIVISYHSKDVARWLP